MWKSRWHILQYTNILIDILLFYITKSPQEEDSFYIYIIFLLFLGTFLSLCYLTPSLLEKPLCFYLSSMQIIVDGACFGDGYSWWSKCNQTSTIDSKPEPTSNTMSALAFSVLFIIFCIHSSMEEREVTNLKVLGSSPSGCFFSAPIAQWKSIGLLNRWLQVQILLGVPFSHP